MMDTISNIFWCLGTILCMIVALWKFSYNIQPKGSSVIFLLGTLHLVFVFLDIEFLAYFFNIAMLLILLLLNLNFNKKLN